MAQGQNQPLNLDEGTYISQGGEIKTFTYYTRYTVANNTTTTKVFTAALGDANFTRQDQTNMPAPGQIPNSQKFEFNGISVRYQSGAAKTTANVTALMNWLGTTAFEFWIQDKTVMYQSTLARILGLGLAFIQDTAAANIVLNSLRSEARPIYILDRKITIAANNRFWANIMPGVASGAQPVTDGDYVDIGLHGRLWTRV